MAHGRAPHMNLVEHRVGPSGARRPIVTPAERRIDHLGFLDPTRVVAAIDRQILARAGDPIAEMSIRPVQDAWQGLGIGVCQEFVRIEALAVARIVRTVHPISVQQTRHAFGQVAVPDLVGPLWHGNALDLAPAGRLEQTQIDPGRMGAEQGEVDTAPVPGGAERIGSARQHLAARGGVQAAHRSKIRVESGGKVRDTDHERPWDSRSSAETPPPLPTSLPP